MRKTVNERPTIGVLAGIQVYYGTILGNFIDPLLHGVSSAAENRGCNLHRTQTRRCHNNQSY